MKKSLLLLLLLPFLFIGCATKTSDENDLVSIQITDQNGLCETISSEEKLLAFQKVDFTSRQPYKRVLRVFKKDEEGKSHNILTTYHPNGQVEQEVECIGTTAQGMYKKWHATGQLHVDAFVIGGPADVSPLAKQNWLFDKDCTVFNEKGALLAKIHYEKGTLEGPSYYYHEDGSLKEEVEFLQGNMHGKRKLFKKNGILTQEENYEHGQREGLCVGFFEKTHMAFSEFYKKGSLTTAEYFNSESSLIYKIENGNGQKAVYKDNYLEKTIHYENGKPCGIVNVFSEDGELKQSYNQKDLKKTGEEISYYLKSEGAVKPLTKKLTIEWDADTIHGTVKTFYLDGKQESQKEFSRNVKNGMNFAWYQNGDLMLMEEYEKDTLIKGTYYEKGASDPISKVQEGTGITTLFEKDGNFLRKVHYKKGEPVE